MSETIPGGYFLNADKTKAHDANGKEIPLRDADKPKEEAPKEEKPKGR
jgi:hypothetical protein